jgi:CheY-like chemotaxis protein
MKPEPILILLVEDDPAHVTAIRRAFETSGSEFEIKVVGTLGNSAAASPDAGRMLP